MAFDTLIGEVYCPKCKQVFEEGSRRFCPTDGSRLVSDHFDHQNDSPGIFSSLLPKSEPVVEREEVASDVPTFIVTEPELDLFGEQKVSTTDVESFFKLDDIEPEAVHLPVAELVAETPGVIPFDVPKPIGRKINPNDIPAGHVDLADSERTSSVFNDYNAGDPESFVGSTVKGRYKVTEYLGGDEAGLAYVAEDHIITDKKVLVRILLEDEADPIVSSILAEERVSLSHFSHPNIARLIDSGAFTDGTEFLVSEYTDALSVRDILSIHGQFPAPRAARVIRQVASALGEAHQQGIIHRDIRPENIILSVSDTDTELVKLVNFGASSGEPNPYNASYKSPEVLDGRVPTVSSDIFSLGVVAYEMMTGKLPFNGSTAKEIVRLQYAGLSAPPSTTDPGIPQAIDYVFEKALSFKAAGRYVKAREFGDAFYTALSELPQLASADFVHADIVPVVIDEAPPAQKKVEIIKPIDIRNIGKTAEPAWKNRSPEPPQEETSRARIIPLVGILALLGLLAFGWYYIVNHPTEPGMPSKIDPNAVKNSITDSTPTISSDTEMPPLSRKITQPPNSDYYSNNKQNLKGDLLRNFVGFSIYYPKEWKINGPQESVTAAGRGKFLDISSSTPDGRLKEQMLVSYYPSKGTYSTDADKFPTMVKETNETLKKLLPGYQAVSEGEIKVNGDWRAYEVKFQGGGTSDAGEKLIVWGRRIFVPASRPGARNGFEITMLATSLADEVRSVDDVGVHGELASILYSFEPTQNF